MTYLSCVVVCVCCVKFLWPGDAAIEMMTTGGIHSTQIVFRIVYTCTCVPHC